MVNWINMYLPVLNITFNQTNKLLAAQYLQNNMGLPKTVGCTENNVLRVEPVPDCFNSVPFMILTLRGSKP